MTLATADFADFNEDKKAALQIRAQSNRCLVNFRKIWEKRQWESIFYQSFTIQA